MARSHGKILAAAWTDDDWTSLPPRLQWMYWTLLGQPKLSLVGCIDYMPARWARLSGETSVDYIEAQIADLEERGYVYVDRDTDELLIRTFVRHDGIAQANANLRKGAWGAWSTIQSPRLRKIAVDNMPPALWTIPDFDVPEKAVAMASEPSLERPFEQASEPPLERSSELTYLPSLSPETVPVVDRTVVQLEPYATQKIPAKNVEEAKAALEAMKARRALPSSEGYGEEIG